MFRFEDPIYLYLLALIPVLALIRFISFRNQKKRLRKFGDPALLKALMPDAAWVHVEEAVSGTHHSL